MKERKRYWVPTGATNNAFAEDSDNDEQLSEPQPNESSEIFENLQCGSKAQQMVQLCSQILMKGCRDPVDSTIDTSKDDTLHS